MEEIKEKKLTKRASKAIKKNNKASGISPTKRSPYAEASKVLGYFQDIGDRQNWIMEKLELWSLKDTSINFFDFLDEFGVPESTYYDMLAREADLKELHSRAKQRIGSRREKMAIYKYNECNERTLHYTLRVYHEDWKKVYEEDRDNRKELAEKGLREPISIKFERD